MAFNQDIIAQLKEQETTLTGTVDPTSVTPEFIGQIYINTTADTVWVAKSLVIGDFIEAGSGSSGTIDIQKDDASVNANTSALNFEGSGVDSVVDDGGGKTTINISGGAGIVGGDEYIDRGDPAVADFSIGDLTLNNAFHELDLSSIVPSDAAGKRVHLRVTMSNSTIGKNVIFRELGNTNTENAEHLAVEIANIYITRDWWVPMDAARKIEYVAESGGWTVFNVTVRGWEREATIDTLVRGDEYVDRGDPVTYDFTTGDLTQDGAWHDLDLSSLLPIESTGQLVLLKMTFSASSGAIYMEVREKGKTNSGNSAYIRQNNSGDFWVKCDDNRKMEYAIYGGAASFVGIGVRGWMKTSDGGAVAGTKYQTRGNLSGWDISSFTKDGNWHNLDLSSIVPESAANQLLHIRMQGNDNSVGTAWSLSHPDELSGINNARLYTIAANTAQSMDAWVRCNNLRQIAYNVPSGYDNLVIAIRGWMQPIDKGQAIQPTYGAPVVHMEWKDVNTITVKAGRYFVDGGWYELESDLDWTWAASGQNFGVDTGGGEANGWWYLYMFLYGDRPAVVASQTAPTAAYNTDLSGTTYDKNIYLGAYQNKAGSILKFMQRSGTFRYLEETTMLSNNTTSFVAKTLEIPDTAVETIGKLRYTFPGGGVEGYAVYSHDGVMENAVTYNFDSGQGGDINYFEAPVSVTQTGYIKMVLGNATNAVQLWIMGWKDKFLT